MKKLIVKTGSVKKNSIVGLVTEINNISCRIKIDIENEMFIVEKVEDEILPTVIGLVDEYFEMLKVDIDNTFEETFDNDFIEERIKALHKTTYWALSNKQAQENDISECIQNYINEINIKYSNIPDKAIKIGDIVDINGGSCLEGEAFRNHIHAIICNINGDMVHVVPIIKSKTELTSKAFITLDVPKDVTYYREGYNGGSALADKVRCVRIKRIHDVIGETTPEFFNKLLELLATSFDFRNKS